jgi:hypothetical protein
MPVTYECLVPPPTLMLISQFNVAALLRLTNASHTTAHW